MCFGGAVYIFCNVLCGRNSVRKAWCVLEHVLFSSGTPLLALSAGTMHVLGPEGWCGTAASQGDPAVKRHVMVQCCVFCLKAACTATV